VYYVRYCSHAAGQ